MDKLKLYFAILITTFLVVIGLYGNTDTTVCVSEPDVLCATNNCFLSEPDEEDYDSFEADHGNIFQTYNITNSKRQVRTNLRRKCHSNNYGGVYTLEFNIPSNTSFHSYLPKNIQSSCALCQDYIILLRKFVI